MNIRRLTILPLLSLAAVALAGCNLTQTAPLAVQGAPLNGMVHGGQQPVAGATIQLYATGSTGYGSAATYSSGTSLLGTNVVTSDANGNFDITGDYTCPSATAPVYIVATGGNPGLQPGVGNSSLAMMAALGPCGALTSSTFISINEITTVASIWPLSPFMTGITNIGTSATNAAGLTKAFAAVNKVANIGTGRVSGPGLPAGATLPIEKINTLADIIAACVNTDGATTAGAPCGILFNATAVGGVAPTNTISAALHIAQHPNLQPAALRDLVTATAPFQPSLAITPNDFSLVITYTGGGLSSPEGIAVGVAGNVWVANKGNSSLTKLDNTGAAQSGASGYTAGSVNAPTAIALDTAGNVWVTNGNSTVSRVANGGGSGTLFSGGGLSSPVSVAIDATGAAWISNAGNHSITKITGSGVLTNVNEPTIPIPGAIAINPK